MSDTTKEHALQVTYHRAYREYRPDCSCGWTGSYLPTEPAARAEHARHVMEEERKNADA